MDSLGATELRKGLGDLFDLDLPATITFDYPSISALAKHISSIAAPAKVVSLSRRHSCVSFCPGPSRNSHVPPRQLFTKSRSCFLSLLLKLCITSPQRIIIRIAFSMSLVREASCQRMRRILQQ